MAGPIKAFKNPVTRPRAIIWVGIGLLIFGLVMLSSIMVTSTVWFCNEVCHHIHDDTTSNFYRSTHTKVSCLSCHMPVGTDPITFMLHKAVKLPELPMAIFNDFELPLNPGSTLSLNKVEFKEIHCTQCHSLDTREVTPSEGIIIDHKVHSDSGLTCTFCHNRVAHNVDGDWEPELISPGETESYKKAPNYMHMTACYRCHDLAQGAKAPGACATCHPANFDLKPADHKEASFMAQHGVLALEEQKMNDETLAKYGQEAPTLESKNADIARLIAEKDEKPKSSGHGADFDWPVVHAEGVNRCYTCHVKESFCDSCHGVTMPHPDEFLKPKSGAADGHPALSKDAELAKKCIMCHGVEAENEFCSSCHHGAESKWEFKAEKNWASSQHAASVNKNGVGTCTDRCHAVKFCNDCHASMTNMPDSHNVAYFTHPSKPAITEFGKTPATTSAEHAKMANASTESCAVCHGEGGAKAQFCSDCHKTELPHSADFRTFHRGQDPKVCQNCHGSFEVCSSCHHIGSSQTVGWMKQHGPSVNVNGSTGCMDKCHTRDYCVECHQNNNVKPESHFAGDFLTKQHSESYKKDSGNCTFCHAGEAASMPNSDFCKSCHKLDMPHPRSGSAQGFDHSEGIKSGSMNRKDCARCHDKYFCDSCHHKESIKETPWMNYHPTIVKKSGTEQCTTCHDLMQCESCHVRLFAR